MIKSHSFISSPVSAAAATWVDVLLNSLNRLQPRASLVLVWVMNFHEHTREDVVQGIARTFVTCISFVVVLVVVVVGY